jgi:phage terminase small subunit
VGRTAKKTKDITPGQPAKPDNLSERASTEWDRLVGELAASGIEVTPAHRAHIALAATIAADIADAWKNVQEDGAYVMTKAGLAAHPATKRLDALRRDYIKVLTMLGLRAAPAKPEETRDELTDLLSE